MTKPKRGKDSDYHRKSKDELTQELKKSYQEYSKLKADFDEINRNLSSSRSELDEIAKKLQACEDQFCNIFDNMFNGVLVVDILVDKTGNPYDHKIVRVNKVTEELTGYKQEQMLGKSSHELAFEWPPELLNNLYQVIKTGKPIEYERYNERMKKYFHTQVFSPAPQQLAFVFDDITSRKKAENQLIEAKEKVEENERRFKAITEQALDGIFLTDTSGNYIFVNPAFCKMTGYTEEELLKMNVFDVIIQDDNIILDYIKKNKPFPAVSARRKLICKDKSQIYTDISVKLIDINNTERVLSIVRDITEQVKTEQELIAAKEKAEESDRLKSAFLMNMSHEIRTPMNAILGFLDLLKEPDLDEDQKHEFIDFVNKSGDRLLATINDIIEISRIDAGEIELTVENVNVSEQLKLCYDKFKYIVESKGLELSMHQPEPEDTKIVRTDKNKLSRIISSLIDNSVKFTSEGSIKIGYYVSEDYVTFFVKDTGKGIPANRFESIFERFVQADMSLTRTFEGSGLGLSIVKAYVEAIGGKIWLQSEVGAGSTFYVSIPFSDEEPAGEKFPVTTEEEIHETLGDITVLIVEDDKLSYQYYEILLASHFKLLRAKNGVEALAVFENNKDISIILMDIKIPGDMDGLDVTRKIREQNKKIPIIAQTAYAMNIDRMRAIDAGCNDYITKPVNKNKLFSVITKYCQSEN